MLVISRHGRQCSCLAPLSTHPARRTQQRGITRADIEHALLNCIQHTPGDDGGTCHLGKGLNNDLLKVWTLPYTDHSGTLTVKSAAWKDK